jgi:hypothetical protein
VADKIRQQVETFQTRDRLKVKLRDGSEKVGCMGQIEPDGFLVVRGVDRGEKILYGDVLDVRKDKRGTLSKVLRSAVSIAAVGGAVFGVMKIGSNTSKTQAVKIPVAFAVASIGGQNAAARVCRD